MSIVISSFTGENEIYSNFYPVLVYLDGLGFPTVEHAYQASKSKQFFWRKLMAAIPPNKAGLARARGQTIRLRSDWKKVQLPTMNDLLCQKFIKEPFKIKLIDSGDAIITEGNYHHDNFWGNCYCKKEDKECKNIKGKDWLGRFIMDIRRQIIETGNCYRRYPQ